MSSDNLRGTILTATIQHRAGSLAVDASFSLTAAWTILFGPSGSGKTTILRAIAGLLRPASGRIVCGGVTLFDSTAGVLVSAHRRPVRTAAQTARLFPQMTVRENLLYGGGAGSRPSDVAQDFDSIVALFQLAPLLDRRPQQLSGGEAQRVSVARAIYSAVTAPAALLLLDEPFTGLETRLRDDLVAKLRPWLVERGIAVLSVTHDVGEAFQLNAEVIRIAEGRAVQQGSVGEVLAEERRRLLEQLRQAQASDIMAQR